MSFAALAAVLGHVAMLGVVREADEGTASRSSGCRGLQGKHCRYWRCKPAPRSQPWSTIASPPSGQGEGRPFVLILVAREFHSRRLRREQ